MSKSSITMWTVENKHWYSRKPTPDNAVYIARPLSGAPQSPLCNRFAPIGVVVIYVADPIEAYRQWLWVQMKSDTSVRREIDRLARLPDGILLCWCAPKPCHADVVVRCIEWYRKSILGVLS